ncbi:MAG: aromatic amino acid lyase, partial [Rhodoferax sp.]|nr:aromatic amino acid lyase [Rhodoferax sp.]
MAEIEVGTAGVSRAEVVAVARQGARVRLAAGAETAIDAARHYIDALASAGDGVYGVSTGFGALATRSIPASERARLQRSLIRSHAAGNGPVVEDEVVRAMLLLRLKTLASGHSGVRLSTARAYAALLDSGLVPVVHEYGSLGCSGDLAPLAHCALALIGEGEVRDDGVVRPAADALADHGLTPVELAEKEGLALINGTQTSAALALHALFRFEPVLESALVVGALTVDAARGSDG